MSRFTNKPLITERVTPVLDDASIVQTDASRYWTDPTDYRSAYESMCDKSNADNMIILALRTDLARARFQRDIWSVYAWCIGLVCGAGIATAVLL